MIKLVILFLETLQVQTLSFNTTLLHHSGIY